LTEVFEGRGSGLVTRLDAQEVRGRSARPGELSWLALNGRGGSVDSELSDCTRYEHGSGDEEY
jgi:hypothetical protein